MATDKTPAHKRIARAEKGREEWKMKAIERREEIEKLKADLSLAEGRLSSSNEQNEALKKELQAVNRKLLEQQKTVENLKKKSVKR